LFGGTAHMARFTINHCRKVEPALSEFDVRILSGEIRVGDSFSCRGAWEHTQFRVLSIRESHPDATFVCEGGVAFDDEFAGITLDTKVVRLPPPDLPIPASVPTPTPEEDRGLKTWIEDWETRAPVQRAACLCLLRGDDTPEKIGRSLGLTADEVITVLKGCGVLYDAPNNRILFR
jgi:hypothetical protein